MDRKRQGLTAVFPDKDRLLIAVRHLEENKVKIDTVFSPFSSHEIQEVLELKPSPVRYFTLGGGILGILAGLGLACYAHLEWGIITSGKPVIPWIPFFVIAFEACILGGVLATMLGMILKNSLFRFRLSESYDPRFSSDRFGLFIECNEAAFHDVTKILKYSGAEEVRAVRE